MAVGPGRVGPPVDDEHLGVGGLRRQEVARLEVMLLLRADLKHEWIDNMRLSSLDTSCVYEISGLRDSSV